MLYHRSRVWMVIGREQPVRLSIHSILILCLTLIIMDVNSDVVNTKTGTGAVPPAAYIRKKTNTCALFSHVVIRGARSIIAARRANTIGNINTATRRTPIRRTPIRRIPIRRIPIRRTATTPITHTRRTATTRTIRTRLTATTRTIRTRRTATTRTIRTRLTATTPITRTRRTATHPTLTTHRHLHRRRRRRHHHHRQNRRRHQHHRQNCSSLDALVSNSSNQTVQRAHSSLQARPSRWDAPFERVAWTQGRRCRSQRRRGRRQAWSLKAKMAISPSSHAVGPFACLAGMQTPSRRAAH